MRHVCVNCGQEMTDLYKQYSPSVLKLMNCSSCQQVGDKYIEYDPVIIMIDLMLLHKEAYRHILYNTSFQNHWKLAVVLLLVEAYAEWMTTQGKMNSEASNPSSPHWFEGEETFYFACIYSILAKIYLEEEAVHRGRTVDEPIHNP